MKIKIALENWHPLADQGNAFAQFGLGLMYQYGQSVPQDMQHALY